MRTVPRSPRAGQRGSILIWVALSLIIMVAFIALGVDGAKLMATRTQLQNAADAGALAGASMFDPEIGEIIESAAIEQGRATAGANRAFIQGPEPVLDAAVEVSADRKECRVTVTRTGSTAIVTHLAHVIGIRSLDASATATARISQPDSVCKYLVPFGAVPPLPGGFLTGCENLYDLFLEEHAGPGNYQLLSYPECNEGPCAGMPTGGANTLECLIINGYECCIGMGEELELVSEPGGKIGKVRDGLNERFDSDAVHDQNICYEQYLARGGSVSGPRVVNVPLVENFELQGRKMVRIVGFSAFFLRQRVTTQSLVKNGIRAEFLYDIVPGVGENGSGTVFALRLIR
jgi:Flp pilus assembly protein TadG